MAATASISFSPSSAISHGLGSKQLRSTIGGVPVTVKPASHVLPLLARRCDRISVVSPVAYQKGSTDNTATQVAPAKDVKPKHQIKRSDFPPGFLFGAGSSAYQVEGAYNEGGKGLSIWDAFTHANPDKIANGDVASDQYHRYKEDVKLLKDVGMDVYRFSLSWPRILPNGTISGGINKEGIAYYNNLINELIENGITPFVTLFHWDLPFALEKKYGGFLDSKIIIDFKEYARLCFQQFGDRVKHWCTVNEPFTFTYYGYDLGASAPGRCSDRSQCAAGDSAKEPYIVSHNIILAHAVAYKLYKDEFKDEQKGEVGITLNTDWMIPLNEMNPSVEARERILDFYYGWYMEPIVHGDYPFIMKALAKDRIPNFTPVEFELIRNSYDFIGINYYSSKCAHPVAYSSLDPVESYNKDSYVEVKDDKNGEPLGQKIEDCEQYMTPEGIRELILYTTRKYNKPPIYLMENGIADDKGLDFDKSIHDKPRIDFYSSHLNELKHAIKLGANVKGFFAWSLLDSFEWVNGYNIRMGLTYVDFKDGQKRYPKDSLKWFKQVCTSEE